MRLLLLSLVVLLMHSCAPAVTYQYKPVEKEVADPVFIFATFKIQKDSANEVLVELIEHKKIDGSLKLSPEGTQLNCITVQQLSNTGEILLQMKVDHPLLKEVEYVNSQGVFQKKTIDLKQAEFFIRMPLLPNAFFLEVLETKEQTTTSKLKTRITK